MLDWATLITDAYERHARLFPALLTCAPLSALGLVVFSEALSGFGWLAVLAVSSGIAVLLAQLGRDLGKSGEKKLYILWGGMPSMTIFRHSDARLDPITKERYHKLLAGVLKTTRPTAQEEQAGPHAADKIYAAWSNYLRANARGEKFELLLKENTSYGFRRNLWGLREIGILAHLITLLICILHLYSVYQAEGFIDLPMGMVGLFALLMLICSTLIFTGDWVRLVADAYAVRLAESLEVLHPRKP